MTYSLDKAEVENLASKLPTPKGYKVLIASAKLDSKVGNVHLPDRYVDLENTAAIMGVVVAMGPAAYNPEKFPHGPYCAPGDWVMFKVYSGTRFLVEGQEFRLINDDQVEAIVSDPSVIKRI